jgi:hypothetical protein
MPKRQQFHATMELCFRNPTIALENKILLKLMDTTRRGIAMRSQRVPLSSHPALYTRYRTKGFPIKTDGNRKYPAWRSLSPWMKLQLASLCISAHPHIQIRLRLHDEIVEKLDSDGRDYRSYLRDRLTRILREKFGDGLLFFFVLEDLDRDRTTVVRSHAHGMVMLPKVDFGAETDGRTQAANARLILREGIQKAEFIRARADMKEALQTVIGNRTNRPLIYNGINQAANCWTKQSYNPLFNHEAISYAFKNVDAASMLPANRIARSKGLATEARRFWDLVRLGEQAISAWPDP